jgi:PEP-CTERM motif
MSQRIIARRLCAALAGLALVVAPGPALGTSIGLNFTGMTVFDGAMLSGNQGYAPPDNSGGVGPGAIAQLINGAFAVYDKTSGALVQEKSGRQFWIDAGVDPGNGIVNLGAFNQRILYDPTAGCWIAAALSGESVNNNVLLARSDTADPTGPWKAVSFLGNAGSAGKFADFTRLGVDANGVYIATTNYTSLTGDLINASLFSVPKADLTAPTPTLSHMTRFDDLNQPGYTVGTTPSLVINFNPVSTHAPVLATSFPPNRLARIDLQNTAGPGATKSATVTVIPVSSYARPPEAAQPDGTRVISTIDQRIKANVYQVGNVIYAVHDVKVGVNVGIKWYKIDETTNQVIQEGVLSDPNYDYFQGSIAANADGDVVIGFNRSGFGGDGQLSIFAVQGTTTGGVTTFGAPFLLKASTVDDYHYVNNRWGDYTTTMVDPVNPKVFWTFQEYALAELAPQSTDWAWATNITQIIVPEPASIALAVIALAAFVAIARRRRLASGR